MMFDTISIPPYSCCEEGLLFLDLVVSVMVFLVILGFRTAQIAWWRRVLYQAAVVGYMLRNYVLRVDEVPRSWITNSLIIFFCIASLILLHGAVKESGLFGRRSLAPEQVP
jgi:hypothetical protein